MSVKHRVKQAVVKLEQDPAQNWAYETWTDGSTAYFAFESSRSADLVQEALRSMFKSLFPAKLHNGRKPTARRRK